MPRRADNLCVDLDGTLIRSDSLWELVARALRKNPIYLMLVPLMLAKGRLSPREGWRKNSGNSPKGSL